MRPFFSVDLFLLSSLVFYQARISSEEASVLCSLHSRLFTAQQDGPSQSFGEGIEAIFSDYSMVCVNSSS